jgi:DNA (cytosine-5)-methyltransferase 1
VVTPFITKFYGTGTGIPIDEPLHTVTAGGHHFGLVVPTLIQTGFGERKGQAPRVPGLHKPLGTVVAGAAKHAVVTAFLVKHYGGVVGHDLDRPIGTVTSKDHHALVTSTLVEREDRSEDVMRFLAEWCKGDMTPGNGLVGPRGEGIIDIGMRMLTPDELFRAQSFPDDYLIAIDHNGKPMTKTAQTELAGNSVCPPLAEAVVRANVGWKGRTR